MNRQFNNWINETDYFSTGSYLVSRMAEDETKRGDVKQIEVVGYYFGRTITDDRFLKSLAKHGLKALGNGYPAGPVIFLSADEPNVETHICNPYHLEHLADEVEFTDGKDKIDDAIRDQLGPFMTSELSKNIASVVTPFVSPTSYDRLRSAMRPWLSEFVNPYFDGLNRSWGRWRLTECHDMYPAHIEYRTGEDGKVVNRIFYEASDNESRRLSKKGIVFPQPNVLAKQ